MPILGWLRMFQRNGHASCAARRDEEHATRGEQEGGDGERSPWTRRDAEGEPRVHAEGAIALLTRTRRGSRSGYFASSWCSVRPPLAYRP